MAGYASLITKHADLRKQEIGKDILTPDDRALVLERAAAEFNQQYREYHCAVTGIPANLIMDYIPPLEERNGFRLSVR